MITDRIDAVTRIPEYCRIPYPPPPKSVKIGITGRCNFRCRYCALASRKQQPRPADDMPIDLFKKITTELSVLGVKEIGVFYIGESFINPPLLVEAVQWCKKELKVPYVFLTTQGSLADPMTLYGVMKSGLDSLKFSVNFCDPSQMKAIAGVDGRNLERMEENIATAQRIRWANDFPTKLYASSIRYDDAHHQKMQAYLESKVIPFVDHHYWLPLYSMGNMATQREKQLGYQPTPGNIGRFDNPVPPLPCWTLFTGGHVLHTGELTACCFDATGDWVMGDLRKESFMTAWHSEPFRELRRRHLTKQVAGTICEPCALYERQVIA